ncbi:MAG: histidine phosphatase family protein [Clostridia bacterium]|nr:histidine phosphatase family protein [Clostridia bacterium]MBR5991331.1 histidine phosphatase family protein [Clostridia bacterium]MBR6478993.1 histidine phosphatase family protein [Clostridia bacterium]MBR6512932.1 histidine phosphatase family protein [Clostridia bacterium]
MKTYKIHLIRHGLTKENFEGKYVGHLDVPVCEEGLEQLKQMKAEMIYPEVDALFISPLLRCRQTADILYPDMTALVIDGLKEFNFGAWEGMDAAELESEAKFPEWLAGGAEAGPPYGETNGEFGKRISDAFLKIVEGLFKTETREAAIVTHGGVIMGLMSMFALPELPMPEWLVPNGCGFTLEIVPSYWTKIYKAELKAEIPFPKEETDD